MCANAASKLTSVEWHGYRKSVSDSITKLVIAAIREVTKEESFESYRELDKAFGGHWECLTSRWKLPKYSEHLFASCQCFSGYG